MRKSLVIALATLLMVGLLAGLAALKLGSPATPPALAKLHHFHPPVGESLQPPTETFPTSLHATREGKRTWYSKANGGFEKLTGIPIEKLKCLYCHPGTYADGTKVDPATYKPDCKDCHVKPGDEIKDEICLKCHGRQRFENANYPDVHRDKGFTCSRCHTSREMHGDGKKYASWLEPGAMDTSCDRCHGTALLPVPTNPAHDIHQATVDCTACHTQSVITCANCHFESEVEAVIKRPYAVMRDYELLVRRHGKDGRLKVHAGTFMTLTYQGKSFVALAPYRAHTITKKGRPCTDCHDNAAVREYATDKMITVTRWDAKENKLIAPKGVIPVPPDWQKALKFDFVDYKGDPKDPKTDPTKWVFLKSGADLTQILYAEPLTAEQMEKLKK